MSQFMFLSKTTEFPCIVILIHCAVETFSCGLSVFYGGGGSFLKGFTSISNPSIICVSREGELATEQGAMIPREMSVFLVKSRSQCEDRGFLVMGCGTCLGERTGYESTAEA